MSPNSEIFTICTLSVIVMTGYSNCYKKSLNPFIWKEVDREALVLCFYMRSTKTKASSVIYYIIWITGIKALAANFEVFKKIFQRWLLLFKINLSFMFKEIFNSFYVRFLVFFENLTWLTGSASTDPLQPVV